MTADRLAWFASALAFATAMSATPGPNNAMVTASGAVWGLRRTVPHMLGIAVGFPAMVLAVALGAGFPIACPVRLLQGQRDPDVPWQTALRLAERLESEDVQVTLIKDGDHRLSRPSDLALLRGSLGALLREDGA